MRILVDAMGGDNAPLEIVKGAMRAKSELGLDVTLVGQKEAIFSCLDGTEKDAVRIVDAREVITMEDDPSTATRRKKDSSMAVALRNAEFVRYGVMHRNTYLNSPGLLDSCYRLRTEPRIRFAGQMTGVEGYVESAASGMLVGIETAAEILGLEPVDFPQETAIGALGLYISGGSVGDFQPMNINFGIIKPLDYRVKGKRNKNAEISKRSLEIIESLKQKEVFRIEDHH